MKGRYDPAVVHAATQPTPVVPAHFIARIVEELAPLEIWLLAAARTERTALTATGT